MPEFKLLLDDDEVERLKIVAAKRRVRPQAVAREAFRAGMAAGTNRTPGFPLIAGSSTHDLKRQIAELTQAKILIENTLDALQRIVNAQTHLDATVDQLERAVATGENPGSGGESDSEDGVKAAS